MHLQSLSARLVQPRQNDDLIPNRQAQPRLARRLDTLRATHPEHLPNLASAPCFAPGVSSGSFQSGAAQRNSFSGFFLFALDSCRACEPTLHGIRVNQACLLELKPASREDREIRDAADVVPGCKRRETFRVHLHHDCTSGEVPRNLRHMRSRRPAWSAPGSPEVGQNRNPALANNLVEFLFVDFKGLANCG